MPRTETEKPRYFSTEITTTLFSDALHEIKKCKKSELKQLLLELIEHSYSDTQIGHLDFSYNHQLGVVSRVLISELEKKDHLSAILRAGIKLLIALSLTRYKETLPLVEESLFKILVRLKERKTTDFEWFYDTLTASLTPSQLEKLVRISVPEGIAPRPAVIVADTHRLAKLRSLFVPEPELPEVPEQRQSEYSVAARLIKLYTSQPYTSVVSGSSAAFLGLDRSGREAICWRELEMSRSKNKDLAKLAGTIAWKIWLFKRPLLKQYCHDNAIEYASLSFSQRAELTQQAVQTYSQEAAVKILDDAVEKELESRKKRFKPETRAEFKGKRVSIGAELEMNEPPFELGILYGWYENLEREQNNDSLAFKEVIEEQFTQLAAWKDAQERKHTVSKFAKQTADLLQQVSAASESDQSAQLDGDLVYQQVIELVENITNQPLKELLEKMMANRNIGVATNPRFLEKINAYWQNEQAAAESNELQKEHEFHSLLFKNRGKEEYQQMQSTIGLPRDRRTSPEQRKVFDIFQHYMGQAQALGHAHSFDSYGEYALAPIDGDFQDPYGLFSREIWELAHGARHDLEVAERPLHITIGWEAYTRRGLKLEQEELLRESSLLNFALTASGVGYRKYAEDFHAANMQAQSEGEPSRVQITQYGDSGRATMIRFRGQNYPQTVEFRGFAPSKSDLPKLAKQLGNLGTAMIGWFAFNKLDSFDIVDVELARIWSEFRVKLVAIYKQYDNFPQLFNANHWGQGGYGDFYALISNFYTEISNSMDDKDGFMQTVARLVKDTEMKVKAVFKEPQTATEPLLEPSLEQSEKSLETSADLVPPPGIEPGVAA